MTCTVGDCARTVKAQGMCGTHYMRQRRHGHPGGAKIVSPGQGPEFRFWSKVDKRGPDECWNWKGARNERGYGVMRPEGKCSGPTIKAHRVSAQIAGIDTDGLFVLHSCDNPPCVNPSHLRVGTLADNSRDAVVRNRISHGEHRPQSKVAEGDVREIRARAAVGETYASIAQDYPITAGGVGYIVRRDTWARVTDNEEDTP